jgi:hypothetical protein
VTDKPQPATLSPPRSAALQKKGCKPEVGALACATQQCGIAALSAFLGRFLPKLGGAKSPAIFCVPSMIDSLEVEVLYPV